MTMLTRIGDLGQSQRLTASLLANQGRVRDAQLAIATGKAATRYEQLGATAGLLLRVEDSRALKASFVEQNEQLGTRLQVMDAALSGLIDIAERARATLVQRLDAGSGTTIPLDSDADAMLEQIAGTLNTQLGQRYLFAGSRSDTAPVALPDTPVMTADPALYYQGDDVRLAARVDVGVEITYGVTAADPAFAGLIAALGQARAAHVASDRAGLEGAMAQLSTALEGIIDRRSELAAHASRLDAVTETHRDAMLHLDELVSGIEDTDVPSVMTRLAQDQAAIEAAYAVTGRLATLSLADYLR